jgi:hypothetical protein
MSCGNLSKGIGPQSMVDQGLKYENDLKKKGRRKNQIMSQAGIIRPDKRQKIKYI